tara:strand:+ start:268 stop:597 length:330 start_codon:yes stop_codon:yes gene_type:complete
MLLRELFLDEGVMTILGKSGNKTVRKYRCTSGSRKGRIVAKPSTCTAALNVKASRTLKTTRRKKGKALSIKSSRTKRTNPASLRLKSLNTGRTKKIRPKARRGSKGKRI